MTKHITKLPDSIDAISQHMSEFSGKLRAGELSGSQLRELGFLLAGLAETVHYYADKLGTPSGGTPDVKSPGP